MSTTKKSTAWKLKNSIFIILAFIPIINAYTFFYMNHRVNKKRWVIIGWIVLILQLALIVIFFVSNELIVPSIDGTTRPRLEDYLGYNYSKIYKYDEETKSYGYETLPEYEEYLKADAEWHKSPEYIAQSVEYARAERRITSIMIAIFIFFVFTYIITIFVAFIEKAKYLNLLSNKEKREDLQEKLKTNIPSSNKDANSNLMKKTINLQKIDVNSATEEELISNLGITIIEAKKAIEYREKNGEFTSKDDFLNSINAKPHIVVKLQDFIIIGESNKTNINKQNNKRRVDI